MTITREEVAAIESAVSGVIGAEYDEDVRDLCALALKTMPRPIRDITSNYAAIMRDGKPVIVKRLGNNWCIEHFENVVSDTTVMAVDLGALEELE